MPFLIFTRVFRYCRVLFHRKTDKFFYSLRRLFFKTKIYRRQNLPHRKFALLFTPDGIRQRVIGFIVSYYGSFTAFRMTVTRNVKSEYDCIGVTFFLLLSCSDQFRLSFALYRYRLLAKQSLIAFPRKNSRRAVFTSAVRTSRSN